jgi:hypothetical protein
MLSQEPAPVKTALDRPGPTYDKATKRTPAAVPSPIATRDAGPEMVWIMDDLVAFESKEKSYLEATVLLVKSVK